MLVNREQKKIVAYQWERVIVANFISCVLKGEEGWNVEFLDNQTQEEYLCKQ